MLPPYDVQVDRTVMWFDVNRRERSVVIFSLFSNSLDNHWIIRRAFCSPPSDMIFGGWRRHLTWALSAGAWFLPPGDVALDQHNKSTQWQQMQKALPQLLPPKWQVGQTKTWETTCPECMMFVKIPCHFLLLAQSSFYFCSSQHKKLQALQTLQTLVLCSIVHETHEKRQTTQHVWVSWDVNLSQCIWQNQIDFRPSRLIALHLMPSIASVIWNLCKSFIFWVMSGCQTQIGLQASIFHVKMHFSNLRSMQFKEWDWSLSVSCRLLLLWFASCNWCCNRNNVVVLRPRSGKQNIMKWFLNMKQDSNFFKQMMDFGCHLVGGFFALQVLSIQKMEICILACVFLGLLHGSLVWATKNSVEQTWPWNLLIC